ncbi:hypothetical protein [Urbifossiella limnaea]|uniref:Uncharacterized protein n=1 Tax=Urbifossiella limnaea TaxID=2528023 RepID=A0A517XSK3_9BACT|nr:hypothetical protein [Urbifossiella limnaea]QDU20481.1 hypothetical protein ETAA1_24330 [Urbifossiella limnaea]
MSRVRALFATTVVPERSTPRLIRGVLTGIGVFTFLFGVFGLQFLAPTRVEMVLALLLLATFAVASAALGQLVVIADHLERRGG